MRFPVVQVHGVRDHILTAGLLILALIMLTSRFRGGLDTLRAGAITIQSYVDEPLANIRVYREALKTNDHLRRQNILLMDEISRLRSVQHENQVLRKMIGFKDTTKLNLYPVTIVSKDLTGVNNILTVNAGSDDSVTIGMPLVNSEGLIGRVIMVASHFSEVMPYLNRMFRASADIQGSKAYGIVSWDGENIDRLVMKYVPQTIKVDSGMVVETSGYSNQFPAHIPIGIVTHTHPEAGKEIQTIYLRPFAGLSQLAEGFIVRYRPDSTLVNLKQRYQEKYR